MKEYITGAEAVIRCLQEEQVTTIFGYPGGTIMPIYDALYRQGGQIEHLLMRHEQGAIHAAQGYARATGKPGVCFATAGPGATNLVTGIADAMMDSTPLVCITAQVNQNSLGSNSFQEADIIDITLPVTKWSYQVTQAMQIPEILSKAFHIARNGRPGPVLISIAKNAQTENFNYEYCKTQWVKELVREPEPVSEALLEEAVRLIDSARKPLMVVGQGVRLGGAVNAVLSLSRKAHIPVATTLLGLSTVPSDFPLYVGNVGMHGNLAPNYMTQECDVLLAVGTRFSDRVTGTANTYAPNAKIIHIEIDRAEIDKNVPAHIALHGNAREIVEALGRKVSPCPAAARKQWMAFAREAAQKEQQEVISRDFVASATGAIRMAQAVRTVSDLKDKNAVVVTDVGQNQMFSARYMRFAEGGRFITSGGLGTMGFGLPAAIGAKTGLPDRQVLVIVGDGGLQMTIQELGTLLQSHTGVKIILLNNSYLGMIRQWQELFFQKRYQATRMINPDYQKLLAAYNIPYFKAAAPSTLAGAVKKLFAVKGPAFLEIVVQEEENVFPMVPAGASLNEIICKPQ